MCAVSWYTFEGEYAHIIWSTKRHACMWADYLMSGGRLFEQIESFIFSPLFFYTPSIPKVPTFSFSLGSEWEYILKDFSFLAGQDCHVELIEPFTFPIFQSLCQGVVWQRAAAPPF